MPTQSPGHGPLTRSIGKNRAYDAIRHLMRSVIWIMKILPKALVAVQHGFPSTVLLALIGKVEHDRADSSLATMLTGAPKSFYSSNFPQHFPEAFSLCIAS